MTENLTQYKQLLKDAIIDIKKKNKEIERLKSLQPEAIAVIGMACRFPGGCNTPEAFWNLLVNNEDALTEMTDERWDMSAYYHASPDHLGRIYSKKVGLIDDVSHFDAEFFGISPKEMESLDPQHRLLLEASWQAIESSGHAVSTFTGTNTGVFIGIMSNDYSTLYRDVDQQRTSAYVGTGNAHSAAAGRISYTYGLNGPCLAVDTACSSSLVSVHLACQSLRLHECSAALAGGVNLILSPDTSIITSNAKMLSARGFCSSFDASADGYVRAEGCGIVLLKRLSDAEKAGDNILAIIKGSAVNQDGKSAGLTVPREEAQTALIEAALKNAGISPADIDYIEAHGSGTPLGDPIEIAALTSIFKHAKSIDNPLLVGSVKTNVGHMEASAGIAGLIKVILALQHRCLPKHLHFEKPNPHIPWDGIGIRVVDENRAWISESKARIAGISSFGFSGTNAHIILEEGPEVARPPSSESEYHLLKLSAQTLDALQTLITDYITMLSLDSVVLNDFCYTSVVGRNDFHYRYMLGGRTKQELLSTLLTLDISTVKATLKPMKVVFMMKPLTDEMQSKNIQFYQHYSFFTQIMNEMQHLGLSNALHYAIAKFWIMLGVEPAYIVTEGECFDAVFALNQMETYRIIDSPRALADDEYLIILGECDHFFTTVMQLYCGGQCFNWSKLYPNIEHYRRVNLPGYPFQRRQFWLTDSIAPLTTIDWTDKLVNCDEAERILIMKEYIIHLLTNIMKMRADEIRFDNSFIYYGLDSLMAMDIKRQIESDLTVSLSVVNFLDNTSLQQFSEFLLLQYVNTDHGSNDFHPLMETINMTKWNESQVERIEMIF